VRGKIVSKFSGGTVERAVVVQGSLSELRVLAKMVLFLSLGVHSTWLWWSKLRVHGNIVGF
jgi:hypothetical protein